MRQKLYRLNNENLQRVLNRARLNLIKQRLKMLSPVFFSLQVSVLVFGLLSIMPTHPLSIPTAFGGGLSFALIWRAR